MNDTLKNKQTNKQRSKQINKFDVFERNENYYYKQTNKHSFLCGVNNFDTYLRENYCYVKRSVNDSLKNKQT